MALTPGTRIGPYEITGVLGVGGMGEVYRARDARLARDVALKVLPDAYASDPERLARFEREAQVLAALKHPNIGAIYGLEQTAADSRNAGGRPVQALVLELVEGETLADRMTRGPIPLDEALPIARQVAEALQAAHDHGIIHRDLKPSNIKVQPDGSVKVLDFGLAKLTEAARAAEASRAGEAGIAHLSMSPTITSPAATGLGVILGTAAYVAPEQAKGRPADKRSDVWAFGCVLFEMLAGKRAFEAEDVSDTLAMVLKGEPDWAALPSNVPRPIVILLRACLQKDRHERLADVSGAQFVFRHRADLSASASLADRRSSVRAYLTMAGIALVTAAVTAIATWFALRPPAISVVRTTLTRPSAGVVTLDGNDRDIAVTPDGQRVIYTSGTQLLVRRLDALEPSQLATLSASAQGLFTSPDGQWVGYVENNTVLKKVAITGGPPITLLTLMGTRVASRGRPMTH